jgi:hypothetical protein
MPTPKRPWTLHLLKLVDSGVHDRSELIERSLHWVPQGHAYRQRERDRANSAAKIDRLRPHRARLRPQQRCADEVYEIGARRVVSTTLKNLIRRGVLVRDGETIARPTRSARVTSAGASSVSGTSATEGRSDACSDPGAHVRT